MGVTSEAELLAIQFRTTFVLDRRGRISATKDPDGSPTPRFALFGCASGNVYSIGAEVADRVAAQLTELAASEPPFVDQSSVLRHLHRYIELLARDAPAPRPRQEIKPRQEMTYVLPNDIAYQHDARLISSDSVAGQELRATLAAKGMPAGLAQMGFVDVGELWEPWCAALQDGDVVSVAFAARLSETGACLGLATAPAMRGRGYAAAATAGWARMPALQSRALFYSTALTNLSSQRVAERLGLRLLGASFEIS
jgi:GNAT acetyltransferase